MRKAEIKIYDTTAGWLTQDENGYHFLYDAEYLRSSDPQPISKILSLQQDEYQNSVLFSFFDGLIPEGWLLEVAEKNWKRKIEIIEVAAKQAIRILKEAGVPYQDLLE